MAARVERVPIPEPAQLRRALTERADGICSGARVVDADLQGHTGVDLLLVDGEGRPVFVDVLTSDTERLPTRVFEHEAWFDQNRRLFLKAYADEGVVKVESPRFVFVSPKFRPAVVAAVAAMPDKPVRLVRVEYFLIDGAAEVLLEDVTPTQVERVSLAVARRSGEMSGGEPSGDGGSRTADPQSVIESESVRALLALFRSGVDGLDCRIKAEEKDDRISFKVGERSLAEVAVSQGSFTVSPGEGLANPIVVSDRVSLERALNSVVSLYIREERPRDGGNGGDVELSDEEREVLSEVWSGAGHTGEQG